MLIWYTSLTHELYYAFIYHVLYIVFRHNEPSYIFRRVLSLYEYLLSFNWLRLNKRIFSLPSAYNYTLSDQSLYLLIKIFLFFLLFLVGVFSFNVKRGFDNFGRLKVVWLVWLVFLVETVKMFNNSCEVLLIIVCAF